MKKLLALLLAVVMVFGLVACGQSEEAQPEAEVDVESNVENVGEEAPAVEEKDPVTITYYYRNDVGEQQYTQQVEDKLNEILAQTEGYEYISIDLVPCSSDFATEYTLAQTNGDQIDLIATYSLDATTMVKNGDLMELSDLLAANPNAVSEIPEWLVEMGKIDGGQYFVPSYQQAGSFTFWTFPAEYAELYRQATGKTKEDMTAMFAKADINELLQFAEDLVLAVREGTGLSTKYILELVDISRVANRECVGVDWGNLMLIEGEDEVVYYPCTDLYKTIESKKNEWYKADMIHPDAATYSWKDFNYANLLNSDESHVMNYLAGAVSVEDFAAAQTASNGFDMEAYQIGDHAYIASKWAAGGNAIYTECEHPQEAMMIIELLMTEKGKEFYNTLVWGLEGTHWEWEDEANERIKTLEFDATQSNASCSYTAWKWELGNSFNAWKNQAVPDGSNEFILDNIHNAANTVESPVMGITWDLSSVEDQVAQCAAVDAEYKALYTWDNFDEGYAEYMAKLEAAGVQDIIDCMNEQYQAHLAG